MRVEKGFEPEQSRQAASHTLYVEGKEESIDYQALNLLLGDIGITIKPIGYSHNIRVVAQALRIQHPNCYFLVDRDHHSLDEVESSWREFPNTNTDNLLIWRRREIENYFLIPEYLEKSRYLKPTCTLEQLRAYIAEAAKERVFFDAANLVILELKKILKQDWIAIFESENGFETEEQVVQKLQQKHISAKEECPIFSRLDDFPIEVRFRELIKDFLAGQETCEFSYGCWLEMVKGKHIFATVVDKCFRVKDNTGKYLQGQEREIEVVKDLVRLPLAEQPADFQQLHALISARTKKL